MTNYEIADYFTLLGKLSDIHGENSFKVKGYSSAAFAIEKTIAPLAEMDAATMASTKGIGASTAKKIQELLSTGQMEALTSLINTTPPGIMEMMQIKGLGPKKIVTIWKELEIETIGELLYACNENRLLLYKGFGAKNQQSIKESIEFFQQNRGNLLFAQVHEIVPNLEKMMQQLAGNAPFSFVGEYALHADIITKLEAVILGDKNAVKKQLALLNFVIKEETATVVLCSVEGFPLVFELHFTSEENYIATVIEKSSSESFWNGLKEKNNAATETAFFEKNGLPTIPSHLRNTDLILQEKHFSQIGNIITPKDIKGIIHNHSDWSDGTNTLEEMVKGCIDLGKEYLVISDHSKSAFYAKGLDEDRIAQQHILIDKLNEKYAPFRIFKSIECDILNDGSLDYDDETLASFDLVIASVHSNLKMTEEKAMMRLMTAIENPFTSILGHMTGRLLASRPGYPLDHKAIIEACAANNVVIELNAHPSRLDMDWKWIQTAIENEVLISIDPDAHNIEGFNDINYGVIAAQKALVLPHQNLSCFTLSEFEEYIFETRQLKGI